MVGCAVGDAVDGSEQRGPAFVMERDDNTGVWEVFKIQLQLTTTERKGKNEIESEIEAGKHYCLYLCFT